MRLRSGLRRRVRNLGVVTAKSSYQFTNIFKTFTG